MPLEIPENKPMQKFLAGLLKNVEDNFSTLNSEVLSFWQCNFHICQLSFEIMFALSEWEYVIDQALMFLHPLILHVFIQQYYHFSL